MRYVVKKKRKLAPIRNIFKRFRQGRITLKKATELAAKYDDLVIKK